MAKNNNSYDVIKRKIETFRTNYPSLRSKSDDYVFSAICIKANLYKNPALILVENDFEEMIVDGKNDGGVDILVTDPNSETADLVLAQSKFYSEIDYDTVLAALLKMAMFYKEMVQGHYENVNTKVQGRFLTLNSEVGEESKIHFIFYTSALQSRIRKDRLEKKVKELFDDSTKIEVSIFFGADIEEEIKESESRRPTVEYGSIYIDKKDNYLQYEDEAIIVNVSAFSIKTLYAQHNNNLLARNLRFHVAGRDIDKGIEETIRETPETFWMKNNGITIICDDFHVDGKEVKLRNFSIINGGQTTYVLHKSHYITESDDLYLPCKIIKTMGEDEDQKNGFILSIAKATNTQKPIKQVDLKANSPEQVRFAKEMREVGIFYQTKRGETIPNGYRLPYLNSTLDEIGKLCLAAIFQLPCASRSKPSTMYLPRYYEKIFNGNQNQIARICEELLYINHYFKTTFQKKYDKENESMPDSNIRIPFAHNSRTICIAFVVFASRYYQNNITNQDLQELFRVAGSEDALDNVLYDIMQDISDFNYVLPRNIFAEKDRYDAVLDKLFTIIINAGIVSFSVASAYEPTLNATNYLKKDKNYYSVLKQHWPTLSKDIISIFSSLT